MGKIENVKAFIENSRKLFDYEDNRIYRGIQLNLEDGNTEKITEFLKLCKPLAEYFFIDALGGRKTKTAWTRERVDDRTFEDVIGQINNKDSFAFSGMKIYHRSAFSINQWESWDGGYIEVFLRADAKTDPDYNELFIWMYIRIAHLEDILNHAKEYIRYFESDFL